MFDYLFNEGETPKYPMLLALLVMTMFGVGMYFQSSKNIYTLNDKELEENLKREFNASVIYKGIEKNNRNTEYYQLDNNMRFYTYDPIFNLIDVGDNLITKKDSSTLEIRKQDTIIYVDYKTDIWARLPRKSNFYK
ncbi:hypothetical protein [Myroides odoratimimus]|uniref:Uncharacterized protein n=1 Tax=Myroides odoratimimus CIP 101113 TaxID=883154 RepID=A0AAV3F6T5_9FLAO|nr:hypothetical protein [Myroides odoratimimus]EHO15075.1 hypothetical protein HMPREF9715_00263 [Myroides odoratimimus CIP 101113]SHK93294.1 hypothetical protein SAMN05444275_101264 [Myroides odoratimimus subsp. xuanwuensis]